MRRAMHKAYRSSNFLEEVAVGDLFWWTPQQPGCVHKTHVMVVKLANGHQTGDAAERARKALGLPVGQKEIHSKPVAGDLPHSRGEPGMTYITCILDSYQSSYTLW